MLFTRPVVGATDAAVDSNWCSNTEGFNQIEPNLPLSNSDHGDIKHINPFNVVLKI